MREILAYLSTLLDDRMKNPRLRPSEKARSVELLKRIYLWVKTMSQRSITTKARIEAFHTILKGGAPPPGAAQEDAEMAPPPDDGADEESGSYSDEATDGGDDDEEREGDDDDDDEDEEDSNDEGSDDGAPVSGDVDKHLKNILKAGEEGNYSEKKYKKSVDDLVKVLMATHAEITKLKDEEKKIFDDAGSKAGGDKRAVIQIKQQLKSGEQELAGLTSKLAALKKQESGLDEEIKDLEKDVGEQREARDTFDKKMAEQLKKRKELEKQKAALLKKGSRRSKKSKK